MNMRKSYFHTKNVGMPPGSLAPEKEEGHKTELEIIQYNSQIFDKNIITIKDIEPFISENDKITWLNVIGTETTVLKKLSEVFSLKHLTLEDIQNHEHRPKIDDFGTYIHTILKMLVWDEEHNTIKSEQISIIWGEGFVISIQERPGDVFEIIRDRIKNGLGRIRHKKSDYLSYAIIDSIVDNYFIICDKLQEQYEIIEDANEVQKPKDIIQKVHNLKKELIILRKSVWPLREILLITQKGDFELISRSTDKYFKDIYDHSLFIIDIIEQLRELLTGLQESIISTVNFEMNSVMKVLTIIATIFIPLTFIAGIYGMNFKYMPELTYKWSYFIVLGVMFLVFVSMIIFIKRKKWF